MALAHSLGDANAMSHAHYWLGYMCYGFGRFRQGERHLRLALELAHQAGDPRLAAWIEGSLGQILAATCQYDEAVTLLEYRGLGQADSAADRAAASLSARPTRFLARRACSPIGASSKLPAVALKKR